MQKCIRCTQYKEFKEFHKDIYKQSGYRIYCKECVKQDHSNRYTADPEKQRKRCNDYRARIKAENPEKLKLSDKNSKLKRAYNLTVLELIAMKESQKYLCSVCGVHEEHAGNNGLVVDHCHSSNKVRELLCSNCNSALGLLGENTNRLQNMISYINKYSILNN